VDAIRRLVVRGAPLLGVAGGFGVALAALRGDDVRAAAAAISAARPTAVNLSWGADRVLAAWADALGPAGTGRDAAARAALAQARAIAAEDRAASSAMAEHGLSLVPAAARILTHCNTGSLVSAGEGTAFAVALAAHRAGRLAQLWVDETRPLLQGARLTAYEASQAGMPHAVLADGAAAGLMASGAVDLVLPAPTGSQLTAAWPIRSAPTAWRSWPATMRCRLSWSRRSRPSTSAPRTGPPSPSSSDRVRRWSRWPASALPQPAVPPTTRPSMSPRRSS